MFGRSKSAFSTACAHKNTWMQIFQAEVPNPHTAGQFQKFAWKTLYSYGAQFPNGNANEFMKHLLDMEFPETYLTNETLPI